jgi:acyl-CoA thioester hydrolase
MAEPYSKSFHVRWGDMDFNAHMSNTAYLHVSADVRMMYFQEHGFSMREFERLRVGPVITRDELEYFRELRLLESITVTLSLNGLSDSASLFRLTNEFFTAEHKLVARVTSNGGWLDLAARKLTPPPEALAELLRGIPKTPNFEVLPSKL